MDFGGPCALRGAPQGAANPWGLWGGSGRGDLGLRLGAWHGGCLCVCPPISPSVWDVGGTAPKPAQTFTSLARVLGVPCRWLRVLVAGGGLPRGGIWLPERIPHQIRAVRKRVRGRCRIPAPQPVMHRAPCPLWELIRGGGNAGKLGCTGGFGWPWATPIPLFYGAEQAAPFSGVPGLSPCKVWRAGGGNWDQWQTGCVEIGTGGCGMPRPPRGPPVPGGC